MAALRRLVSADKTDDDHAVPDVVTRLLEAIGLDHEEAHMLATTAHEAELTPHEPGESPSVACP